MGSDWKEIKLGELVKPKGGKRLPKGTSLQTAPNKHPYIRVRDMGGRDLSRMGLEFVPDRVFPSIKRYIVEKNDVIISIVGTVGLVSIIDDFYHLASQTENCAKLSGFDSEDAQYIYYYLISNFGQEEIRRNTVGAVQPKLPLYGIEDISIFWPEKIHRLAIGNYFFSIDNKIQLNRETNQTLEAMAQALFKSWFVDFDPVFDNIIAHNLAHNNAPLHNIPEPLLPHAQRRLNVHNEGQNNADNVERGSTQQVSAAHAFHHLFPQAFEQSDELSVGIQGWVPKGWGGGCLSDISLFGAGKVDAAEINLDNYISTENMIKEKAGVRKASGLASTKQVAAFTEGQILISNIRPYFKKIWFANCNGGRSNDVLAVEAKSATACEYVYSLLYQDSFFEYMTATSKGTKMPRGDKKAIMNWGVTIPPLALMEHFSCLVKPLFKKVAVHNENNAKLESLRDTLLPKLISGELRIPDAEQASEAFAK